MMMCDLSRILIFKIRNFAPNGASQGLARRGGAEDDASREREAKCTLVAKTATQNDRLKVASWSTVASIIQMMTNFYFFVLLLLLGVVSLATAARDVSQFFVVPLTEEADAAVARCYLLELRSGELYATAGGVLELSEDLLVGVARAGDRLSHCILLE